MARGHLLSSDEKAHHEGGLRTRAISRQIERSPWSIRRFLESPHVVRYNTDCGHPWKITTRDERKILRTVSNSTSSLNQIRSELNLSVSKTTVWRAVRRCENITRQAMEKVPRITDRHKEARLGFAKMNLGRDWAKVDLHRNLTIELNNSYSGRLFGWKEIQSDGNKRY